MVSPLPFLALLALLGGGTDEPDTIVLRSGKSIECRVVFDGPEKVVYTIGPKTQEVARTEIERLDTVETSLREFLKRFEELDPSNPAALTDLAAWAEAHGLLAEAHDLWIRILTVAPLDERAWTKLGRRQGQEGLAAQGARALLRHRWPAQARQRLEETRSSCPRRTSCSRATPSPSAS
jgi:hypothetical protein